MESKFDVNKIMPIDQMEGEDARDTALLREMYAEAEGFILAHPWCEGLEQAFFGIGVGGVVAVFLFKIIHGRGDVDDFLWVIVGDLPPAYIVCDFAPNPACALDGYIEEMTLWIDAVKKGESIEELIPVNVPPEEPYAKMLEDRLNTLDKEILSHYEEDLNAIR
ncbi:MAG: hypothetical protein K8S27_07055 [Candidatus Omnitrophica bacterium]|nr:hypothetical protein [Candidatus Omnitrophota bacterium]